MPNNYTFLDAYASVQTAEASVISGTVLRPIVNIGSVLQALPTTFSGSPSISGAVTVIGNPSVSGQLGASVIGTVPVTQSGTRITSVSGIVDIAGSVAAAVTFPTNQNVAGSVVAFQGTTPWVIGSIYGNISGSVAATVTNFPTNQNVSGSVVAFQGAGWSGSVAATVTNTNVNVSGSVVGFQGGTWGVNATLVAPSIVGTYAEDAAHSTGEKGLFVLGVRNDTLTTTTSADSEYSPVTVGPAGETISVDAPYTKWVSGIADLRVVLGASVVAIPAQGTSVFTYIREVQVANFGPSSVLVKIGGGLGSTLGWTIAPAGGGSNFTTRLKTGENSAVTASINGTASVLVTLSGFTAKT